VAKKLRLDGSYSWHLIISPLKRVCKFLGTITKLFAMIAKNIMHLVFSCCHSFNLKKPSPRRLGSRQHECANTRRGKGMDCLADYQSAFEIIPNK